MIGLKGGRVFKISESRPFVSWPEQTFKDDDAGNAPDGFADEKERPTFGPLIFEKTPSGEHGHR